MEKLIAVAVIVVLLIGVLCLPLLARRGRPETAGGRDALSRWVAHVTRGDDRD